MTEFEEARYLQPLVLVPETGARAEEFAEVRAHGYDFYDFEYTKKGDLKLTLMSDWPVIGKEAIAEEVKFLKKNLPGLYKINIVAKRSTAHV